MRPSRRLAARDRVTVLRRDAALATVCAALAALLGAAGSATSGTPGAPGAGDPYFPLSGDDGYHVRHYDLDLRYDISSRHLAGSAVLTARATQPLTRFALDLTGLKVADVTVDRSAARFSRSGRKLLVTPRRALRAGQEFHVTVRYDGTPRPITDPDGSSDGWIPTDDGAFVAGQPQGAMTWFPANAHPRDKSSYDIAVTVPKGRTAVANGVPAGQRTVHGYTTFRWRETQPMAAYLATATVGTFQVDRYTTRDGIRVYTAVDPRQARAAAPVLRKLPSVLAWESKLFGPYPYRAAGAVVDQLPDVVDSLEAQTRPVYVGAPDLGTLVHESAHQWFGDSVSVTTWQDIWLNEGFATYAEWLYAEQHGGDSAQQTFDALYARPRSDDLWSYPPGDPGSGSNLFGTPVYERGAMALHELRRAVGDRDFLRILRAWAAGHRGRHGTTAQFVQLAEHESGKSLDGLFHTWLYADGKPDSA